MLDRMIRLFAGVAAAIAAGALIALLQELEGNIGNATLGRFRPKAAGRIGEDRTRRRVPGKVT